MGSACLNGLMGWKRESRPHPVPRRLRRGVPPPSAAYSATWLDSSAAPAPVVAGPQQIALGVQHLQKAAEPLS